MGTTHPGFAALNPGYAAAGGADGLPRPAAPMR